MGLDPGASAATVPILHFKMGDGSPVQWTGETIEEVGITFHTGATVGPVSLHVGDFFRLREPGSDLVPIAEVRRFWTEMPSGRAMVELRFYYRPEETPQGRLAQHGKVFFAALLHGEALV